MGRGATVNAQLLNYCQYINVDVALVQEPYTRRVLMVGLEAAPLRSHLCPGEHCMNNGIHGSGIVVFNLNLNVLARDVLTTDIFTDSTLDTGENKYLTSFSVKFKFRTPTTVHTTALSNIIDNTTGD